MKNRAKALYEKALASATPEQLQKIKQEEAQEDQWRPTSFEFDPKKTNEQLVEDAHQVGVLQRKQVYGDDISGLQELVTYGLKGLAAYAEHAFVLNKDSEEVFRFIHEALAKLSAKDQQTMGNLVQLAMDVGKTNIEVMRLLDEGHTTRYGHPKPTKVLTSAKKGKCILVSGHDLRDLEELLKQTEGTCTTLFFFFFFDATLTRKEFRG